MPQTNNITIQFKADGDNKLLKALKDLATAQRKLNKEINNAGQAVDKQRQRVELNSRTLEKNNSLVNKAKAGIAQYRNTLLLGAFAMGLFSKTVGKLTSLFAEQEAAEKKLSTALGFVNQELLDFASSMQQITTFGDEVTISAMSQAAAFTTNTEAIKQITIAAQDLAAGRGMDLKTAMDLVSKSVFSSTNALSRYGIEIGKTGSKTEKFNKIMAKINEQYGGQAAAQVDTYAGATQQLANTWGDLGEKLGGVLAEGLLPLVKVLSLLATGMQKLAPIFGTIIKALSAIALSLLLTSQRMIKLAVSVKAAAAALLTFNKSALTAAKGAKALKAALSIGLFLVIEFISKMMGKFGKNTEAANVQTVQLAEGIKDLDRVLAGKRTVVELKAMITEIDNLKRSTAFEIAGKLFLFGYRSDADFTKAIEIKTKMISNLKSHLDEVVDTEIPALQNRIKLEQEELDNILLVNNLKEKQKQLDVDREEVMKRIAQMELDNIAYVAGIIPKLQLQNELLENKNKHSGSELELQNLLSDARARGIDINELDIDGMRSLIEEKTKLTNVMKTELFITNSFNQALVQGINNNARFAESFGNMVKKMAAQIVAHMATFLLFKSIMPGSSLFAGFTNPFEYAISKLTGTTPVGAGSAMQGVALESQNAAMQGGGGSVVVNFSGNVMSQDFIENDAIPQIRDAIRRGADIGVS